MASRLRPFRDPLQFEVDKDLQEPGYRRDFQDAGGQGDNLEQKCLTETQDSGDPRDLRKPEEPGDRCRRQETAGIIRSSETRSDPQDPGDPRYIQEPGEPRGQKTPGILRSEETPGIIRSH